MLRTRKTYITNIGITILCALVFKNANAQLVDGFSISYDKMFNTAKFGRIPSKPDLYCDFFGCSYHGSPNKTNVSIWADKNYKKRFLKGIGLGYQTFQFSHNRGDETMPHHFLITARFHKINIRFDLFETKNRYFYARGGIILSRAVFLKSSEKQMKVVRQGFYEDENIYRPFVEHDYDQPLPANLEIQMRVGKKVWKNKQGILNLEVGLNMWARDILYVGYVNANGAYDDGALKTPWFFNFGLRYEFNKKE